MINIIDKQTLSQEESKIGSIFISYLERDNDFVEKIFKQLDEVGILYFDAKKSANVCGEYFYFQEIFTKLKNSSVGIFICSPLFDNVQNSICTKWIWYEMGILISMGKRVIPYYKDIDNIGDFLRNKPIGPIHGTQSLDALFKAVDNFRMANNNKDEHSRLLIRQFFPKNFVLNNRVNKRIITCCLIVTLNIYKENFEELKAKFMVVDKKKFADNNEVLSYIINKLKVGSTIVRFGKDEFLNHPAYSLYRDEGAKIEIDYPAQYETSKVKVADNRIEQYKIPDRVSEDEIKSNFAQVENKPVITLKIEYPVQNHEILGVSFKPFIRVKGPAMFDVGDVVKIIEKETEDLEDIFVRDDRVYFLLPMDKDKCKVASDPTSVETVGKRCNYLFPK